MRCTRTALISILIAATGLAGFLFVRSTGPQPGTGMGRPVHQPATGQAIAKAPERSSRQVSKEKSPAASEVPPPASVPCLSASQLESDAVLAAEYARLDSVTTSGPTIASYRGLSSTALEDLASQGDSPAMAVLGAVSVMRAGNLPETGAVAYLLREEPSLSSISLSQSLDPDVKTHIEEASDWFYRSALHGRLLALRNAGEMIAIVAGAPTKLGWIGEDEYESLRAYDRIALDPAIVYEALAFEIAPQLKSGPFGAAVAELTAGGERQQLILNRLVAQFKADREAANVPPIAVPMSAAPSLQQFEAMLCDSYLDSVP